MEREKAAEASAESFACEGCGSQLLFEPESGALKCIHCGALFPVETQEVVAKEYVFNPEDKSYEAPTWSFEDRVLISCAGCGARIAADAASMTASCGFCGSNQLIKTKESEEDIMPETMIPFKVGKERAREQFQKWIKGRWFAPFGFKKEISPEKLSGLYLPFWTFDTAVKTSYSGQGGKYYYVTKTRKDANGKTVTYRERHTRWYPISGEWDYSFDDLTCAGTDKLEQGLLSKLGGFSVKILNPFNTRFLAGFSAERYDVGPAQAWEKVRPEAQSRVENDIKSGLGYDTYSGMNYLHKFSDMGFKHILLPVWLSSYRYKKKLYTYMINGETGVTAGKAPVSALKIILLVLAVLAAAFLAWPLLARLAGGHVL